MTFLQGLEEDLHANFLCTDEFGEDVVLVRDGLRIKMPGLFDTPSLDGDALGIELEAVAHRPRLFVKASDLPGGRPRKNDVFELKQNEYHPAGCFRGVDFVFERDGVVVYRLMEDNCGKR